MTQAGIHISIINSSIFLNIPAFVETCATSQTQMRCCRRLHNANDANKKNSLPKYKKIS